MRLPNRSFWSRHVLALGNSIAVLALVVFAAEAVLRAQLQERESQRRIDTLSYASALQLRLERELSAQLNLTSGLAAYLAVQNANIDPVALRAMLAELHRTSRHVRNFAIAIGYRLLYVHPLEGNEGAVGLYYPDQPQQWPVIQRIARTGQAALAGPVNLVQGRRGLIYRTPILVDGRYWGLLSTVIDPQSLFQTLQAEVDNPRYQYAIRGQDGLGRAGGVVWGALDLFDRPDAVIHEMQVPGGQWAIAVRDVSSDDTLFLRLAVRGAALSSGLMVAVLLFLLIRNRSLMAQRALYDDLTGLPNRRLLEDRALMAFSRQQRQPDQLCALLFLDLDDFKAINDAYGHKAGDAVLRVVAQRAQVAVRQNDTVARWGGDEFIVLLENVTADGLEAIIERLRNSIGDAIEYRGQSLRVGVSLGVAFYPEDGEDLDRLLHAADRHMYSDKIERKSELQPVSLAQ